MYLIINSVTPKIPFENEKKKETYIFIHKIKVILLKTEMNTTLMWIRQTGAAE